MIRRTSIRIPLSAVFPAVILIIAVATGALHPDSEARRVGWAVGMIAIAWLLALIVALYQELVQELGKVRQLLTARIATVAIEKISHDVNPENQPGLSGTSIDDEWQEINRRDE